MGLHPADQSHTKKLVAAVVAVVDDPAATPPAELVLAWWCNQYHALPSPGGMLDQEYQTLIRMQSFYNIHGAMTRLRAATGEQIHQLDSTDKKILKIIQDMGLL